MNINLIVVLILCLYSCSPYPKGMHDDCLVFAKKYRSQWVKEKNGFYSCTDIWGKRKSRFDKNNYLLEQEFEKYEDCFANLSPKQIKKMFGNPTKIQKSSNERFNYKVSSFYYLIRDSTCNVEMKFPYVFGAYEYNMLSFVFYNGKQTSYSKPRFSLYCE